MDRALARANFKSFSKPISFLCSLFTYTQEEPDAPKEREGVYNITVFSNSALPVFFYPVSFSPGCNISPYFHSLFDQCSFPLNSIYSSHRKCAARSLLSATQPPGQGRQRRGVKTPTRSCPTRNRIRMPTVSIIQTVHANITNVYTVPLARFFLSSSSPSPPSLSLSLSHQLFFF